MHPDEAHEARSGTRRITGVVFALLFLVGLVTPALVAFLDPEHFAEARKSVLEEKRKPVSFPDAPTDIGESLQQWPRAFETWWNDAFGLRTALIRWHNMVRLFGFGVEPGPSVLLGHDEQGAPWMFVSIESTVDDFRGMKPFGEKELETWKAFLEQRRDWLAANGCRYLFVVAPNKSSIYPEYMPPELTVVEPSTRLDQLVAYMAEHSTVPVLDLRPALLTAKTRSVAPVPEGSRLYFPLGTHWNSYGAWVGQREIMRTIGDWFPRMWPTPLSLYKITSIVGQGDTWASRFHMDDVLRQAFPVLTYLGPPKVTSLGEKAGVAVFESSEGGPVCVVLRDSFSTQLGPHLAPHFSKLALAWNQTQGPDFTITLMKTVKPDLVIEQVVERYLSGTLPTMLPSTPRFR